jgi:hypothetical protein
MITTKGSYMKRKLLSLLGAVALTAGLITIGATPAQALPTWQVNQAIISSPDDGSTPWARDSFTRKTTIKQTGTGTYRLDVTDTGTFKTGTAGPHLGGSNGGDIVNPDVVGTFSGNLHFNVTGTLLNSAALAALQTSYDYTGVADKNSVPADLPTTGTWYKHFFSATTTADFFGWTWTYQTPCEKMIQSEADGVDGNVVGYNCVTPGIPTYTNATCSNPYAILHIPATVGVTYNYADGRGVVAGSDVVINATAATGYKITTGATASWEYATQQAPQPSDCHPPVNRYPGNPRPTGTKAYYVSTAGQTWQTVLNNLHYSGTNIAALQQWNKTHSASYAGKTSSPVYSSWWNLNKASVIAVPTSSPGVL